MILLLIHVSLYDARLQIHGTSTVGKQVHYRYKVLVIYSLQVRLKLYFGEKVKFSIFLFTNFSGLESNLVVRSFTDSSY